MNNFILFCKNNYPNLHARLEKRFQVYQYLFRSPSEQTLGFYLYFHLKEFFPECKEIILYESPLIGNRSDYGTADFICLTTNNKIMVIELKFIDVESSGHTAQVKRNKARKKVIEQVLRWKRVIMYYYNVPEEDILCRTFTTDSLTVWKSERAGLSGKYVPISKLRSFLFLTENLRK